MVLIGCPHVVILSDICMATHEEYIHIGTISELVIASSCCIRTYLNLHSRFVLFYTKEIKKKLKLYFLKERLVFSLEGRHNVTKVVEEYCWALAQTEPLSWYIGVRLTTGFPVDSVPSITTCL